MPAKTGVDLTRLKLPALSPTGALIFKFSIFVIGLVAGAPTPILLFHFMNFLYGNSFREQYISELGKMGFGFIEVGTVTPRAQDGNPRQRLFRLKKNHAIINRMGFNNKGVDKLVDSLKRRKWQGIVGVNIGKNLDTPIESASEDYIICLKKVYALADYVVINPKLSLRIRI